MAGAGRARVPFLGGIYLRYVPRPVAARALKALPDAAVPWSYCHPYDLDTDEPFHVMAQASWLVSRILHTRRGATLRSLDGLLAIAGGAGLTLGELARRAEATDLPVVRSAP